MKRILRKFWNNFILTRHIKTMKSNNSTILDISGLGLIKIRKLPEGITELYCCDNKLTSLPKLPEGLRRLVCHDNKLTSLPKLPESLRWIYCGNNKLSKLPELLPESLRWMNCDNNNLSSLPKLSKNLKFIDCHNNNLSSLPDYRDSLLTFNCYGNNFKKFPKKYCKITHNLTRVLKEIEEYNQYLHMCIAEIPDDLIQEIYLKQKILSYL